MMLDMGAQVQDVLIAAEEAGRQLAKDGKMSEKTLSTISRELVPKEMYVEGHNLRIKQFFEKMQKMASITPTK